MSALPKITKQIIDATKAYIQENPSDALFRDGRAKTFEAQHVEILKLPALDLVSKVVCLRPCYDLTPDELGDLGSEEEIAKAAEQKHKWFDKYQGGALRWANIKKKRASLESLDSSAASESFNNSDNTFNNSDSSNNFNSSDNNVNSSDRTTDLTSRAAASAAASEDTRVHSNRQQRQIAHEGSEANPQDSRDASNGGTRHRGPQGADTLTGPDGELHPEGVVVAVPRENALSIAGREINTNNNTNEAVCEIPKEGFGDERWFEHYFVLPKDQSTKKGGAPTCVLISQDGSGISGVTDATYFLLTGQTIHGRIRNHFHAMRAKKLAPMLPNKQKSKKSLKRRGASKRGSEKS